MGVTILGTSTIVENAGGGGPIMYAADAAAKTSESAPPVKIGPVNVSAQVTVTFLYHRRSPGDGTRPAAGRPASREPPRGSLMRPAAR